MPADRWVRWKYPTNGNPDWKITDTVISSICLNMMIRTPSKMTAGTRRRMERWSENGEEREYGNFSLQHMAECLRGGDFD